ncbi:MAG: hypothetical protein KF835_02435 [Xanthobacteraceae bacterium]|nr:hypothetical protein [Xanthobacteraceae bacterium]
MLRAKLKSAFGIALVLAPLSLGLAGCETLEDLSPFDDKKKPLSGERRALFPGGVPGVELHAPPQQPSNSNIQLQPQTQAPDNNPDAQTQRPTQPANTNTGDDPWAGQRR